MGEDTKRPDVHRSGFDETSSSVSDLAGVALRGISAAIVVFLAVQGGLAVLSGAGSDPNPYVLLLACFVTAVFSERVWQTAYEYLRVQLASNGKTESTQEEITAKKPSQVDSQSSGSHLNTIPAAEETQ
jgi:hypothetical protein